MVNQFPAVGSHVTSLTSMEVAFSKTAFGVDAFALLVNGVPATIHYYRLMIEHVRKVLDEVKRVYPGYAAAQGYELGAIEPELGRDHSLDPGNTPSMNPKKGTP